MIPTDNHDFSSVATSYSEAAVVQQMASDRLFQLLRIRPHDRVVDVGCGSGELTARIRTLSKGRICGIDPALGMIEEARSRHGSKDIEFLNIPAQKMAELGRDSFDVVFCNSSFHWINPPAKAVHGFAQVLTKGGKVGIQAAAMSEYCPNFVRAMEKVRTDKRTADGFKDFIPPWSFLETEDAYVKLFSQAGFSVPYVSLEQICTRHTVKEAFGVFSAGAAAGYLDKDNYRHDYSSTYMDDLLTVVRDSLLEQADKQGMLELRFNRIYLVAFKT